MSLIAIDDIDFQRYSAHVQKYYDQQPHFTSPRRFGKLYIEWRAYYDCLIDRVQEVVIDDVASIVRSYLEDYVGCHESRFSKATATASFFSLHLLTGQAPQFYNRPPLFG
jgi:hypothetical protein